MTVIELKKLGIQADFPPAKLKQAHGDTVCLVLNSVLSLALEKSNFQFYKPEYPANIL